MTEYGNQRLTMLAERLIMLTQQGKITWREGARGDNFHLPMSNASVTISTRDGDGRAPFSLDVYNESGTVVDSLQTEFWWHEESGDSFPQPWNEALESLYELARRSALNIDSVINALLSELPAADDEPPF